MPKKVKTVAAPAAPALPPEGQKSAAAAAKEIAKLDSAIAAKKAPRRLAKQAISKAPAKGKKAAHAPGARRPDTTATESGLIPLKAICAKLAIDPKRARVVLRRRLRAGELHSATHEIGEGRWNLTPAKAELVRATLKEFLASVQ